MEIVNTTGARVVRMNNKSIIFELLDGRQVYATKRVANDVLSNDKDIPVYVVKRENKETGLFTQLWLATPSIF